VTLSIEAPVTFRSGIRSPVYVDNRRLIFHPGAWHIVVAALIDRIEELAERAEVVAGVESAGIPHSSALAFAAGLPSVFVRKAVKGHGLGHRVEGGDVSGRRVILARIVTEARASRPSMPCAMRVVAGCLAIITSASRAPTSPGLRAPARPDDVRAARRGGHRRRNHRRAATAY
jgi:orotate phosphoribosyltransferase